MDLSEMLASPPPRPMGTRVSSDNVDQNSDSAFAAAVDAADAETSGETSAKNGETTQSGAQEPEGVRDPAVMDSRASDGSQAETAKTGLDAGRAPFVAAPNSQPDLEVLPKLAQTPQQPVTRQSQATSTAVVTTGKVVPTDHSQPVQLEENAVVPTVKAEVKPTQTSQADSTPKAATPLQPATPENGGNQAEIGRTVNDVKPAASIASNLEQPQPAASTAPVRSEDAKQRRSSAERVAPDPDFRVSVQRTTPSEGPEQPAGKLTNPSPAVPAPIPDSSRTTARARSSTEQVQIQNAEADLPVEAPKPSADLKLAPDLPTRRVVTQSQGTVVSTSMTTSATPLGAAPVQGSQLQTAALPSVALIDQNPGLVETRIGPQLTAAAGTRSNGGVVEVLLEPPELGRVEIQMELSDQGLRATLAAERQATTDLLRRNLEVLAQQFEDAGFADVDLDFASFGDGQLAYEQDGSEAAHQGPEKDAVVSQKSGAKPSRMSAHDGVVDIRL